MTKIIFFGTKNGSNFFFLRNRFYVVCSLVCKFCVQQIQTTKNVKTFLRKNCHWKKRKNKHWNIAVAGQHSIDFDWKSIRPGMIWLRMACFVCNVLSFLSVLLVDMCFLCTEGRIGDLCWKVLVLGSIQLLCVRIAALWV